MKASLPVLIACAIFLAAPSAHANSELRALSVSGGYAGFDSVAGRSHGGVVGLSHDRRLSDKIPVAWRVSVTGGAHQGDDLFFTGSATLGLSWLLSDTLKYVPYVTLGAGAVVLAGPDIETDVVPRIELGLGIDLLKSRTFSYGIQIRAEVASPFDISQTGMLIVGGRATWRWGFF